MSDLLPPAPLERLLATTRALWREPPAQAEACEPAPPVPPPHERQPEQPERGPLDVWFTG